MQNNDAATIGAIVAGFIWTIWWNLDWRRYLKFYGIKGPTYPIWVQVPFRSFFAVCSLGTAVELGRQLLFRGHSLRFYFECLLAGGAYFGVIVLMVFLAELTLKNRESKTIPREKEKQQQQQAKNRIEVNRENLK